MGITGNFRKQHKELLETAAQISSHLNPDELSKDATEIYDLLMEFANKTNYHLKMEDDILYPALLRHPEKIVRALAKLYLDKMGRIKNEFNNYMANWPDPKTVRANPDSFINETKEIFEILSRRMDKEDNELYSFIDKDMPARLKSDKEGAETIGIKT